MGGFSDFLGDFFRWPTMGKSPGNVKMGSFFTELNMFRMMKHGNFSWKSGEFWTGERWDECENRFFARFPESICYLIILPCQKYGCEWPMINGLNMIAPLEWFKASNQPGWIGPGYNPRMDRPGWFINKGFPPFQTNLLIGRREWRVYQIGPSSFYTNFPVRIYIYIYIYR